MMVNYIVKDKTIIFSSYFNSKINIGLLKKYYNVIKKNDFNNLGYIGSYFNQQVNLPQNLTFGEEFNQQVNLTHLTFDFEFNQQVNLPFNVKYLNIDCDNVNIIDYLPDSVEELVFGSDFNLESNDLPSSIKNLLLKI